MPYQLEANSLKLPFEGYETANAHPISDRFGSPRPYGGHEGIDWACPSGTSIHAMIEGVVTGIRTGVVNGGNGLGNFVTVRTGRFTLSYGHLQSVSVAAGDEVEADDELGRSGNTGYSSGPHLHVEFKPDEPLPGATVHSGAVDFQPFLPVNAYDWNLLQSTIDANEWLDAREHVMYQGDMRPPLGPLDRVMPPFLCVRPGNNVTIHVEPDTESPQYPCDLSEALCRFIIGKDNSDWDLPYYHPELVTSIPVPGWWQIAVPSYPVCWVRRDNSQVRTFGLQTGVPLTHPPAGDRRPRYLRKPAAVNVRTTPRTHDDEEQNNRANNVVDDYSAINDKWCPILGMACDETDTWKNYLWYQVRYDAGGNTGWVRGDVVTDVQGAAPALANPTDMPFSSDNPGISAAVPPEWAALATLYNPTLAGVPINFRSGGTTLFVNERYPAVTYFQDEALPVRTYFKLRLEPVEETGTQGPVSRGGSPRSSAVAYGWVPETALSIVGNEAAIRVAVCLRLSSWVTLGANVRSGPDKAYDPPLQTLRDHSVWFEVVGKNAANPTWWRIEYAAGQYGWIFADLMDVVGDTAGVPVQNANSPVPQEPGPMGEAATGTGTTSGAASGDYRNLVTNPDGRWAVWKSGRTVTANFSSPRSPVQYYARQNPQPQFVVPAGFRPTRTVTQRVTGTQVNEDRTPVIGAPAASFDLVFETDGEMRYVDNSRVDHLGYVSYSVTHLTWETDEELVVPLVAGTLAGNGTFINQANHQGSSWSLTRSRGGTGVTGSFSCTRSPVDYYANGNPGRAAVLVLPAEYRPAADVSIRVTGAIRVNEDSTDSTDMRRVDFDLTMQRDGYMWYDRDATLTSAGVGYLRFGVSVSWTAEPLVPTAPRDLEAEDVEATEVELDWTDPQYDGGDSVDEYAVEVWDSVDQAWEEEEDGIRSTRFPLRRLDPYTRYSFRVLARNRAGWGEPSTAVTVTTLRAAPGAPSALSATATHERVTLGWGTVTGPVTGYTIARRVGSGSWRTLVYDTQETARAWVDTTVAAATSYEYRVAAHNYGEQGDWSAYRRVTTAAQPTIPGSPSGLMVAPGAESRLQLTWTVPTDTGGGVTGYRIERSPDELARAWTEVVADTGAAALSWGDSDVAADTVYVYRVSALNSAGVGTPSGEATGRSRPQLTLGGLLPYPLTAHAEPRVDAAVTATFAAYLPGRSYDLDGQLSSPAGWWRWRARCWVRPRTCRSPRRRPRVSRPRWGLGRVL